MTTLRIGIIGVAGIAGSHVEHLQKIDEVEVAAIADISTAELARRGEEWDIPADRRYDDFQKLVDDATIDAVSVCTPNGFHCTPTVAALEAGKHVLVEKPLAMTVAEGERMVAAAQASGRQLVTGFQWRFGPKARFLKAQYDAGRFGDMHFVRVQAWRRRLIPSWGVFTDKSKQGGGALIDWGVHFVEMAHHIIGKPRPVQAYASAWTSIGNQPCAVECPWGVWKHENYTVEDASVAMVRFDNNVTMIIETSFAAHLKNNLANVTLMGSNGGGTYDPIAIHFDDAGYMLNAEPEYIGKEDLFGEKMRHFVGVCRGERPNISSGEDGLAVQRILNGVYEAIDAGTAVDL